MSGPDRYQWQEEEYGPIIIFAFFFELSEAKWNILRERMMVRVSRNILSLMSRRIIRAVSQLLHLSIQLQRRNQSRQSESETSYRDRIQALPEHHLHKHYEIAEETLARSFNSSNSKSAVSRMLLDMERQLNQGLRAVAVARPGAEIMPAALRGLHLACKVLIDVSDQSSVRNLYDFSGDAAVEVMAAITDCVSDRHQRGKESVSVLQELATRMAHQWSERRSWTKAERKSHAETISTTISCERIHKDLVECQGVCTQVLKGLLGKYLILSCPQSFGLMSDLRAFALPAMVSTSTDLLNIVFAAVTEICQKNKSKFPLALLRKIKPTEVADEDSVVRVEFLLQEKLHAFFKHHKEAVTKGKRSELAQIKRITNSKMAELDWATGPVDVDERRVQIVKTMVDKMQVICSGHASLSSRLQALTSEEHLPSLSLLLTNPMGHASRAERAHCFVEAAVKHLLLSVFQPPPSWGMGRAIRVQRCQAAAVTFEQTTNMYDHIIASYVQMMCHQVIHSEIRMSEACRLQLQIENFLGTLDVEEHVQKKIKRIMPLF